MCLFTWLPYFSKCCGCINLRTGAYFIGILQLIFGSIIVGFALTSLLTDKQSSGLDIIFCIIGGVFVLLSIVLLLGVKIKNVLLLKVYILSEEVGVLIGFIIFVILFSSTFFGSNSADGWLRIAEAILVVIDILVFTVIALKVLFLLYVTSYLKDLIKEESGTTNVVLNVTAAEAYGNNTKVV